MNDQSSSPDIERLRQVLGAFYKTVDVMKSARNQKVSMPVWADDMKAVEDAMLFLENLRDASLQPATPRARPQVCADCIKCSCKTSTGGDAVAGDVQAARTSHPAARGELAEMVYEAVRFANFAAGEGFCPAPDCMEAKDPAAFLSDFCKFNETDDYEAIADLARDAILAPAQPKQEGLLFLASELEAFHDCADGDVSAGNGHFRLECLSESNQQRLNLRAVLREAATALRLVAGQPVSPIPSTPLCTPAVEKE